MYEKQQILSVNSHRFVKEVCVEGENLSQTLSELHEVLAKENLPRPQILNSQKSNTFWEHLITGPQEYFRSFDEVFKNNQKIKISKNALSSVTATCHGLASSDFPQLISQRVEARGISIHKMLVGALSVTLIIGSEHCDAAIQKIHDLISNPVSE